MIDINDITSVLAAFEDAAKKHAIASEKGDYNTANKNFDRVIKIVDSLKSQNKIDYLLSFLNNPVISVRLAAASFLLFSYEKEAVKVLEEIMKGDDLNAFHAEMTLKEWRKGNLKL